MHLSICGGSGPKFCVQVYRMRYKQQAESLRAGGFRVFERFIGYPGSRRRDPRYLVFVVGASNNTTQVYLEGLLAHTNVFRRNLNPLVLFNPLNTALQGHFAGAL